MRRTAGDVQVDRHHAVGTVVDLGMIDVRTAGNGAGTYRDHDLRRMASAS